MLRFCCVRQFEYGRAPLFQCSITSITGTCISDKTQDYMSVHHGCNKLQNRSHKDKIDSLHETGSQEPERQGILEGSLTRRPDNSVSNGVSWTLNHESECCSRSRRDYCEWLLYWAGKERHVPVFRLWLFDNTEDKGKLAAVEVQDQTYCRRLRRGS